MQRNTGAVCGIPPNESSMILDVGGTSGVPLYGGSHELSAGMNGITRCQYNSSYSANESFTINQNNCAIGLLIQYAKTDTDDNPIFSWCFLPIVLPVSALSLPAARSIRDYQLSIVYALNLYFTKWQNIVVYTEPGLIATYNKLDINNPNMPILQDQVLPPLTWKLTHTGQLMLFENRDVIDSNPDYYPPGSAFTFTLVTLDASFMPDSTPPFLKDPMNGWMNNGKYLFGFGKFNGENRYVDNFTYYGISFDTGLKDNLTENVEPTTYSDPSLFYEFNQQYQLTNRIVAENSMGCIGTCFETIQSPELSKVQLRSVTTNTNTPQYHTVGFEFHDAFSKNFFHDHRNEFTIYENPILNMDPTQGRNRIGIDIKNEFGESIIPYNPLDVNFLVYGDRIFEPPTQYPPAPINTLDPFFTTNPTHDCILPYVYLDNRIATIPESYKPLEPYNTKAGVSYVHHIRMISHQ